MRMKYLIIKDIFLHFFNIELAESLPPIFFKINFASINYSCRFAFHFREGVTSTTKMECSMKD